MIMRQVAAALQRANELGLVHRDIKPENILLTRKAEVKVTDFGLSRYFAGETRPVSLTQSGMTLGTPLYMSPEQVQGKPVDHRSDLYSFGVTCYHLLAGHPPYQGANAFDVAVQHVQGQAIPLAELRPDLPAPLTQLIAQMMARSANDRPANAKEVLRQISRIQKAVSEGTIEPATGTVPGLAVSMTGVALGTSGMSSGLTLTHPVSHSGMVPVPSSRWPWRILGFLALGAVLALGWFALSLVSPTQEPAPVPTIVGLPEERPPTVISIREQQYREGFLARPVTNKVVLAGLKLGLLLLSERRLSEASTLFGELEELKAPTGKNSDVVIPPGVLGKFGLGAVLAFSDKPQEALAQFQAGESLLRQVRPPIPRTEIERFFFQNIDFAQVVAESLARIAESQKLPTQLEWLRTPNGILRGNR
jgi:serine/threonine-protein kinase